jgi:hypothetical protein
METTDAAYPVRFDIDYPEEPRNRLSVAFRLILVIPIVAVIAAIGAAGSSSGEPTSFMCFAAGVLFLPSLMLIVARQKYPRWWFDFSVASLGFHNRVAAYLLLTSRVIHRRGMRPIAWTAAQNRANRRAVRSALPPRYIARRSSLL